jgi:hypothetical protein
MGEEVAIRRWRQLNKELFHNLQCIPDFYYYGDESKKVRMDM